MTNCGIYHPSLKAVGCLGCAPLDIDFAVSCNQKNERHVALPNLAKMNFRGPLIEFNLFQVSDDMYTMLNSQHGDFDVVLSPIIDSQYVLFAVSNMPSQEPSAK